MTVQNPAANFLIRMSKFDKIGLLVVGIAILCMATLVGFAILAQPIFPL